MMLNVGHGAVRNCNGVSRRELMPQTAQYMDRCALIRSMTSPSGGHSPIPMMTGFPGDRTAHGAVITKLKGFTKAMPPYVHIGPRLGVNGGNLGAPYNPAEVPDATGKQVKVPDFSLTADISADRFLQRRELLSSIDRLRRDLQASDSVEKMTSFYQMAVDMLTSTRVREAFDLSFEKDALRNRYGANHFGQSCLMARRLVEAGTRFVQTNWYSGPAWHGWDVHGADLGGMERMEQHLCPRLDQGLTALLQDLEDRGMLKTTLVVVTGEFGWTPKINKYAARDHWPRCFSLLMAGGGVPGGTVVGASDNHGALPAGPPGESDRIRGHAVPTAGYRHDSRSAHPHVHQRFAAGWRVGVSLHFGKLGRIWVRSLKVVFRSAKERCFRNNRVNLSWRKLPACDGRTASWKLTPRCFRGAKGDFLGSALTVAMMAVFSVIVATDEPAEDNSADSFQPKLRIASSSYRRSERQPKVYFYDHDGGSRGKIAGTIETGNKERDSHAVLSADGDYCAFAHELENQVSQIFFWDAIGKKLVTLPTVNDSPNSQLCRTLSSDGTLLAFAAWSRPGSNQRWDILLYNVAAEQFVSLPRLNTQAYDERMPALSGDGKLLAFTSNSPDGVGSVDIYLYDVKTSTVIELPAVNSPNRNVEPTLSQTGRWVAFSSDRSGGLGGRDIYVYDRASAAFVDLPGLNSVAHEQSPFISADGRYIVFVSERISGEGERDIFLYDRQADKLLPTPALNAKSEDFDPSVVVLKPLAPRDP